MNHWSRTFYEALLLLVCGLYPAPLLEPLAGPARLLVVTLGGTP